MEADGHNRPIRDQWPVADRAWRDGLMRMRARRRLIDRRSVDCESPPEDVFAEIERLGGAAGWPAGNPLWRLRGHIDSAVGGVGMRRGRLHPERLEAGDYLDFWRVEEIDRPRLLRLRAELRLPGQAWLQFEVEPRDRGARLLQSAIFDPGGIAGYAYWYALLPVHSSIFRGMINALAARAVRRGRGATRTQPSEM
jgi:hypothetical protein